MSDSPGVDLDLLRTERLARLQASMRHADLDACLLFNEPNCRYATGASAMPVYSMSTFVRCAVVPAEGDPILFEHANSIHRSRLLAVDARPMHPWEFFDDPTAEATVFASMAVRALEELGAGAGRVGVDRLGTPAFLALQDAGLHVVDAAPATQAARAVKTSQEVILLRHNGMLITEVLGELEAAIEPGVSERELPAVLSSGVLRRGAEYLATNTVCAGPNTVPWRAEATGRAVRAGEIVYVDTDTVGVEGYFFCVSRTFACAPEIVAPPPEVRDTYRAAHEWVLEMTELLRPGITCGELASTAPAIPERFVPQRYECMVHGIGLEEENPSVCHPEDPQSNAGRVIEPNMALVVEVYMGEVGGTHGVKLGDQVLVTTGAAEVLAPYPWDAGLLAP